MTQSLLPFSVTSAKAAVSVLTFCPLVLSAQSPDSSSAECIVTGHVVGLSTSLRPSNTRRADAADSLCTTLWVTMYQSAAKA